MAIEVLIIEDESRAANQLLLMLKATDPEFQSVGIIDTVKDAVQWFQKHNPPDLVFMDIQLADGLSFEIFQMTPVEVPIIFTTAFDQYAIQAFKVNSIDYLLKPIQVEDLNQALEKYRKSKRSTIPDPRILKQLLDSIQMSPKREGILVRDGGGYRQIRTPELLYCYSEEGITFGITATGRFIIDETMDGLFESLDQNQFYRINRGQLVAKTSIRKIESYFNHRVKLSVTNPRDQEFIVSRTRTGDFKEWMNK